MLAALYFSLEQPVNWASDLILLAILWPSCLIPKECPTGRVLPVPFFPESQGCVQLTEGVAVVYTKPSPPMIWRHLAESLLHSASLRGVASGCIRALAIGVVFYFIVYLLERASGGTTTQYQTRGFMQDVAYWFYYRSGLNNLLFMAALFSFLHTKFAFLQLSFVNGLHPITRGIFWFVAADFGDYWTHRLQHKWRFMWAFHSTHHAQEQLNFATTARFHPVDFFLSNTIRFVPLLMFGASPMSWLPIYLTFELITTTLHSRITWRFGALSRIFVTPRFHSFHHSADPRHYDRNFGGILSIWDYMFGTAVDAPEQPAEYGLPQVKMPTLASTLVQPFRLLRQLYAGASSSSNDTLGSIVPSISAEEHPNG
jgi:sterol desaturase/sphingolipid hydroxylase (fatty acid hydroxylase superfamily)